MSMQCFSVLKQQKSEQKQCLILNSQINNQELESFQLIHTLQSPLSGNSQFSTENGSFTKLNEKMIEEPLLDTQNELIFSDLDNAEYCRQTLVFTNMKELKQAIQKIKHSYNGLVMSINEIQIDNQPDDTYKLMIITKKFIHHNFTINISELCIFIEKVLELDLSFSSSIDIIQYQDESIHINPISLVRNQDIKSTFYEILKLKLQQFDKCESIQQILEILRDYENEDLEKLKRHYVIEKEIYKLKLQLINLLLKRRQI
ncbi:unnamed protein product [Paramecium sonneborni]|uniref:Uncharacterized protein n=1 Tax=Paramecium sonneborni TaxID=65129 RepID=A0A8S1R5L4_9CILI|nr:unnamed protein product [Paramecium sonneborni]